MGPRALTLLFFTLPEAAWVWFSNKSLEYNYHDIVEYKYKILGCVRRNWRGIVVAGRCGEMVSIPVSRRVDRPPFRSESELIGTPGLTFRKWRIFVSCYSNRICDNHSSGCDSSRPSLTLLPCPLPLLSVANLHAFMGRWTSGTDI